MKKLAAFDLDGTLSQSDRFLLPAYRKALALTGRDPLPDSLLLTLIGGTAADNARVISPDGSMETYEEFNFHVVQAIRETIPGLARAYPGVEESLRELRRLGYKIYLCSNARREYTDLVLGQIGLLPLFDGTPEGRDGWDKPSCWPTSSKPSAPARPSWWATGTSTGRPRGKTGFPSSAASTGCFPRRSRARTRRSKARASCPKRSNG